MRPRWLTKALRATGFTSSDGLAAAAQSSNVARIIAPIVGSDGTRTKEIAARLGLSSRQLSRDAGEASRTFHVPAQGFRDIVHLLRLRAAVMLLGAPEATVAHVAGLVGYGSAIAMGRAFRDAELPPPSEIRIAMRGDG